MKYVHLRNIMLYGSYRRANFIFTVSDSIKNIFTNGNVTPTFPAMKTHPVPSSQNGKSTPEPLSMFSIHRALLMSSWRGYQKYYKLYSCVSIYYMGTIMDSPPIVHTSRHCKLSLTTDRRCWSTKGCFTGSLWLTSMVRWGGGGTLTQQTWPELYHVLCKLEPMSYPS